MNKTAWLLSTVLLSIIISAAVLTLWLHATEPASVPLRLATQDAYEWPASVLPKLANGNPGTLTPGTGLPSTDPGSWLQFRGADRQNIADPKEKLLRSWPTEGPQPLWRVTLGEGHAGPAVHKGRVFLIDYDDRPGKKEDAIRCLSLEDGSEIWRYTYSVVVKPQHGMSRAVPAVNDDYVVTIGPRGHVHCLKMETGEPVWKFDMVKEFATQIPSWYTGQCPLIDGDVVILAPGGNPLMMAVELSTGKVRWKTPNPGGWSMTHSSVVPMDFAGSRQYLYCTTRGVVGVDAETGKILWTHPWTIGYAVVPMPVPVPPDRVFLSGGYRAESVMLKLAGTPDTSVTVQELFRTPPETFGSDQQTPILYQDHLYAVIPKGRGQLACMDLNGEVQWTSGFENQFHLGPYLLADGSLLVLSSYGDNDGVLYLVEASPGAGYRPIAKARVLTGHECWGPMALINGKLLARDSREMVCLKIGWREP